MSESRITEIFDLPDEITEEYYDSIDCYSRESIWQLCYRDLRDRNLLCRDLSSLSALSFNTQTVFPRDVAPIADRVLNDGRDNIVGTKNLYAKNITGRGVKVAIIDRPINKNHVELKDKIEYIEVLPDHAGNDWEDFHGMVCASFLCGNTCGVAKESELVYFAISNKYDTIVEYYGYQIAALKRIIEYNRGNHEPVRVVSLSAVFDKTQLSERDELIAELDRQGCCVVDALRYNRAFTGIDLNRYAAAPRFELNQWQKDNYEANKTREGYDDFFRNVCVYVPATRRTSASNYSDDSYIHWSKAVSASWSIPHVAGTLALLLQGRSEASGGFLSWQGFVESARKCPKRDGYIIFDAEYIFIGNSGG